MMNLQSENLKNCIDKHGFFVCPSCKEGWFPTPEIENEGENKTQIYCGYNCGYIFLEDYNLSKNQK